jgi:hypothetical protein
VLTEVAANCRTSHLATIKQALRSSSFVNEALLKEISIIEARRFLTSSDMQAPITTQECSFEVAE